MVNISAERKKMKADNRKQSEEIAELQVSTVYFKLYSNQLLINTVCVSYGSPHQANFVNFCEFSNFDFNLSMRLDIFKDLI